MMGIYKIENLVNGKMYIGSSIDIENRWKSHKNELKRNSHHNIHLQRAWNTYTEKYFDFVILEILSNENNILKREQYYIDQHDFSSLYNICPTAGTFLGYSLPEKTKNKMSKSKIGKNNSFYGRKHTKETKEKISRANRGRKQTKKEREKRSRAWLLNGGSPSRKEVYQIDKNTFEILNKFDSITKASKKTNINRQSIRDVAHKKPARKTAGGFIWCFVENYFEGTTFNTQRKSGTNKRMKTLKEKYGGFPNRLPVFQIDIESKEVINKFDSVSDAAKFIGCWPTSISKCCNGIIKTSHGYIWKFA